MSLEIWNLERDLCRCCHAEGSFDNLAEPKKYLEREEIYSDMLRDCFNIEICRRACKVFGPGSYHGHLIEIVTHGREIIRQSAVASPMAHFSSHRLISNPCPVWRRGLCHAVGYFLQADSIAPVPGEMCAMTYKICEACISRLRYAVSFKKQVQDCEEKFMELYYKNAIKVLNKHDGTKSIVKEEVPEPFLIDFKEEDFPHLDNDTDDEDYHIKDDDEDPTTDEETNIKSKQKHKTKDKVKEKPKLKRGRPRKIKDETQREGEKEKKDESSRSFRLQPDDYRRDGDRFACCRCEKKYDKMCSLRFHIKTKHYKIPRFTCPYCMKGFMTHAPFTIHKLEDHNIDERYYCKACKGTFNTKIQLRKHINNFHMLGERYKCDLCDYESFSFEGMYKHKFKHKTSKDYHCRFCRKSFLRKTTLDLHERIHTGDRRKVCKVCSQAFVQKASLNYHMTKYHPDVNF